MAERIYAGNFLKEASDLTTGEIKEQMENVMELNQRVVKKGTNIILSFSPADAVNNERLARIAMEYMEGVGFGQQPYIVYRHLDTFTPHLYIISVNIRPDGSHIHRRYFGGSGLRPLRAAIEAKFGLIKESENRVRVQVPATPGQKVRYGEKPTTETIAETVQYVRQNYQFRSLSELNAILRQYNIMARAGRPGTRLHQWGGLQYQILDNEGKGRGVPVRASILKFRPTLKALNENFRKVQQPDLAVIGITRLEFDTALREGVAGSARFQDTLRRGQIAVAPDLDDWGKIVGLLLVDFSSRVVVRSTELGEGYDLASIRKKLAFDPLAQQISPARQMQAELKQKRGRHL